METTETRTYGEFLPRPLRHRTPVRIGPRREPTRERERPIETGREPEAHARLASVPVLAPAEALPQRRSEPLNRAMNVACAGVALLALIPLFVVVALLVKLTSPGPIFYRQTRVGLDRRRGTRGAGPAPVDCRVEDLGGRVFTILKFRTMRADAEGASGAVWATRGDPRVTPLGRVLRKSRIDELPQLINVLIGDMNIVGPRPERPSLVRRLRNEIAEYALRHRSKPGITGWAQINHHYDACIDDVRQKVRYDLEYQRRQSLLEDVRIMCLTIPVMLLRRSGW